MNWQKEVIRLIDEHFKSLGINYTPRQEVDNCLVDFFNYEMKLINPLPRKVYISDTLKTRKIPTENFMPLLAIEKKIIKGESLTFHQSKSLYNPLKTDDLLNDWLIHHLHLSDWKDKPSDKFFARTKFVLFVLFSEHEAFFIDIRPHGKEGEPYVFAKKELLEIIDNNWPRLLEKYIWTDVFDVSHNLSDEEIHLLRKKGISGGAHKINGKVIHSPGIGITTTGQNIQVVRRADWIVRYLHEACQELDNESLIKQKLSEKTGIEINEINPSIQLIGEWPFFGLYESNSKCFIENGNIVNVRN